MGKRWCNPPEGSSSHLLAVCKQAANDGRDLHISSHPSSSCWQWLIDVWQSWQMLIQPPPAVPQPPKALRVLRAELFSSCATSAFPGVIWSLVSTWGAIPPFPSSSALSHGKMVSLYPAKAKTIKFFCPFLVFLVVQHDPHSIPGLLSHISGLNSLAEVLGSPCQHICHPLFSSGGLLWIHPSQLHCRSLGCWRAP